MHTVNYSNTNGMRRSPISMVSVFACLIGAVILVSLLHYYISNRIQAEYDALMLEHVQSGKTCSLYVQEPAPTPPTLPPVSADCDDRCQLLAARNHSRALRNYIDVIMHNEDTAYRTHVESCGL